MKKNEASEANPKGKDNQGKIILGFTIVVILLLLNYCFTFNGKKNSQNEIIPYESEAASLPQEEQNTVDLTDTFHLVDQAKIINSSDKNRLLAMLQNLEKETSTQIVVYTIDTLNGDAIENKAVKLFQEMKIGKKGLDNGVLLLIALKDRQMRIEVGYGLEGVLTDLRSGQIVRNILVPAFKEERYSAGILNAVSAMISIVKAEPFETELESIDQKAAGKMGRLFIYFFIVILILFLSRYLPAGFISSLPGSGGSSKGGGFFSGNGSSGGSSSGSSYFGGGGSSGGGGASGRW